MISTGAHGTAYHSAIQVFQTGIYMELSLCLV